MITIFEREYRVSLNSCSEGSPIPLGGSLRLDFSQAVPLYLELSKFGISSMVTVSVATGYLVADGRANWSLVASLIGSLMLACGAGALNQIQEQRIDSLMERTRRRPLPTGRITVKTATLFTILLIGLGSFVLYLGCGWVSFLLGLLALLWYNGIYTYLKRVTAYAVIPGAFIGAIPPVIGWAATGRSILEWPILGLALFLFVWQIPHFWLLLLRSGKDYERAGLPSLTDRMTPRQLGVTTFLGIIATVACSLILPALGSVSSRWIAMLIAGASAVLLLRSVNLLKPNPGTLAFRGVFILINIYALAVMLLMVTDHLI